MLFSFSAPWKNTLLHPMHWIKPMKFISAYSWDTDCLCSHSLSNWDRYTWPFFPHWNKLSAKDFPFLLFWLIQNLREFSDSGPPCRVHILMMHDEASLPLLFTLNKLPLHPENGAMIHFFLIKLPDKVGLKRIISSRVTHTCTSENESAQISDDPELQPVFFFFTRHRFFFCLVLRLGQNFIKGLCWKRLNPVARRTLTICNCWIYIPNFKTV